LLFLKNGSNENGAKTQHQATILQPILRPGPNGQGVYDTHIGAINY